MLIDQFNKQQLSGFLTENLPILNPYLPQKSENLRPHLSQSSRENATPSTSTSLLAFCKGVPPPPLRDLEVVNLFQALEICPHHLFLRTVI